MIFVKYRKVMKMKTLFYINDDRYVAGTTLKDETLPEQNNMALHVCENPNDILLNRKKLAQSLNTEIENFVCANQTHSANFYKVTSADKGRGATSLDDAIPNTDALYTFEKGIVLASFTADCVPIIFTNDVLGVVGVIHSGWQGTVKEITLKLFTHLVEKEVCTPEHFRIYIGPAISQDKFEVDSDVYEKFKQLGYADDFIYYKEATNKYHIDNKLTVKRQCELVGIPSENIIVDETCTFISEVGFSYREDRGAGRHLSFMMKK